MLLPKRVKYRRQHRPDTKGRSKGGNQVSFGEYGLQATTTSWITARQIEAARIAMTRYMKRGGKVWINIFPHTPYTKKPLEVRMGSGKGAIEGWIAVVKPGRVMLVSAVRSLLISLPPLPITIPGLPVCSAMFTRFAARSISTLEIDASLRLVSIYSRTFKSSCNRLAKFLSAYHFASQSRMTPTRNPIGFIFWPKLIPSLYN